MLPPIECPPTPEFLRLTLSVFADSGRLQKGGVCYISLVLVESEKRYPFWPTGAPSAHIISLAGNLLQDFLAIQELDPVVACFPILQQWRPPELNQHKFNFDAAIFRATNSAGIGVVVRDWRGEFVGALSISVPLSHTVADMEALACRKAVEFAAEIGLQGVIFEGDSAMVINALNQGSAGLSTYGVVIEDIRCQAMVFQSSVFNHASRSCNCVADALAKKLKAVGYPDVAQRST